MRILICGAHGFIGGAIADRLSAEGHEVIRAVRTPKNANELAIDFERDTRAQVWVPRLQGIDAVVNAVGILNERPGASFEAIHHRTPAALFQACESVGIKRVVQISALGAETATTPYFRSKLAADQDLAQRNLAWIILRPSWVYGRDGESADLFRTIASLPAIGIPNVPSCDTQQAAPSDPDRSPRVQPVHVEDLVTGVVRALDPNTPAHQTIAMVGASPVSYRAMLASYRQAMQFAPALTLNLPAWLMGVTARCAGLIPGSSLTPDTWRMLQAGSVADPRGITQLLGNAPRALADFIPASEGALLRQRALAQWQVPVLQIALAFVWIMTALVSLCVFPRDQALALLAPLGLSDSSNGVPWASATLYAAALLDLLLGLACLFAPSRKLWVAQIVLILSYSVAIAWFLPAYLMHPFGPILKNIPILALLLVLESHNNRTTSSPTAKGSS